MMRVAGVAAVAATALVCIAAASGGGSGLFGDGDDVGFRGRTELGQQAVTQWLHTLKGAESFLDDSEKGKLPAKSIVPQSLSSVEKLLKETVSLTTFSPSPLFAPLPPPFPVLSDHSHHSLPPHLCSLLIAITISRRSPPLHKVHQRLRARE